MQQPTILLLGGRHKGSPTPGSTDELRRTVRAVIAYGEAAPTIVADIGTVVPTEQMGRSFEEVDRARSRDRETGRRRAAVARLLELRHVQELRGARHSVQAPRCDGGGRESHDGPLHRRAIAGEWVCEARALVLLSAALLAFGLAVLYSASAIVAIQDDLPSTYYLFRQIAGLGVGVVAFASPRRWTPSGGTSGHGRS
jgi:hypothetical protein